MEEQAYAGKREGQRVLGYLGHTFEDAAVQCAVATGAHTDDVVHVRELATTNWQAWVVEEIDKEIYVYRVS